MSASIQPETFYHIYNHANGRENLFESDENYRYFLGQWKKYIEPIANTYAYCLMPNHVHFLIRTKNESELEGTFGKFETFQKLEYRFSKQFANLFSSYTQAFNKMVGRKGSLFVPNFKRNEISNDDYLTDVICYIHSNPVHHGFVRGMNQWQWSSFGSLISNKATHLKRLEVIESFGGIKSFLDAHKYPVSPDKGLRLI